MTQESHQSLPITDQELELAAPKHEMRLPAPQEKLLSIINQLERLGSPSHTSLNIENLAKEEEDLNPQEIPSNMVAMVLDGEGSKFTGRMQNFIQISEREGLVNMKNEAQDFFTNNNLLAIFTSNPENIKIMDGAISKNGEDAFLNEITESAFTKLVYNFPKEYQGKAREIISDKLKFDLNQRKLQELISKEPGIADVINRAKYI